jgi:hypothetical protein
MNDSVDDRVNDRTNEKDLGRTIVICPKCGENNSNTFRFCGMCGTLLEARRPANATVPNSPVAASNVVNAQEPQRSAVVENIVRDAAENSPRPTSRQVPPISGPSMLGLNADSPVVDRPNLDRPNLDRPNLDRPSPNRPSTNQPGVARPGLSQSALNQIGFSQTRSNQRAMNEPVPVRPEMDSFRPTSFTGLDSFFEHEQPKKTSALRVVLLIVLLAALAGAGWWTYGYLDNAESRKSQVATNAGKTAVTPSETQNEPPNTSANNSPSVVSNVPQNNVPQNSAPQSNGPSATPSGQNAFPSPDAGSSPVPPPSAAVPETPSQNATTSPDTSAAVTAPRTKAAAEPPPVAPRVAMGDKTAAKPQPRATPARALKPPEPAAADTGTADFQKGEAYLYGRGAPESCDQAVKYLKSASAKSNAKARSAFGTMYATGHCVARDLPTSYLWFAMALRVDPNNQILEKDLSAIWNQMTPPERQLATRMKQ